MVGRRAGSSYSSFSNKPLVLIIAFVTVIGLLVWVIFDYSLLELGRSPMSVFLTFFLVYIFGHLFYRLLHRRNQEIVVADSFVERYAEVSTPQPVKTQLTNAGILVSTAALLTLPSIFFSDSPKILLGVVVACLYIAGLVILVSVGTSRVTLSNESIELTTFFGSHFISLSTVQKVRIRRSLSAWLTADTPGDILVVTWRTKQGQLKEKSIILSRYAKDRNLLFAILKRDFNAPNS